MPNAIKTTRRTNLSPLLANRQPFANTTGSLRGGTLDAFERDCFGRTSGWLGGDDLNAWRDQIGSVDYVVTSYATPIAWHTPNGWHIVEQRFSVTTSNHQGQIRRGLHTPTRDTVSA